MCPTTFEPDSMSTPSDHASHTAEPTGQQNAARTPDCAKCKAEAELEVFEDDTVDTDSAPVLMPTDPSTWQPSHIVAWLHWLGKQFHIRPRLDARRFPTDGGELMRMSRSEFWVCAGSRLGGQMAARHMAFLVRDATGRSSSPLFGDSEPGEFVV